jgi:hypothetical protein
MKNAREYFLFLFTDVILLTKPVREQLRASMFVKPPCIDQEEIQSEAGGFAG